MYATINLTWQAFEAWALPPELCFLVEASLFITEIEITLESFRVIESLESLKVSCHF
jgi:hypothetical protein